METPVEVRSKITNPNRQLGYDCSAENRFQSYGNRGATAFEKSLFSDRMPNQPSEQGNSQQPKDFRLKVLRVTHDQISRVTQKGVLKIFRRFGRVLSLGFDQERQFWSVQYGYTKEAHKASKAVALDKLYGYRFYQGDGPGNPFSFDVMGDPHMGVAHATPCVKTPCQKIC